MDTTTNTILTYIALGIGFLTAVGTSVSLFMHWLAPRTPSKWDDNALAKLDEVLTFLRGLAIPPAPASATTTTTTSPQTPSAKAAQAGRASLTVLAALALGGAAGTLLGCTSWRSNAATGVNAFIDCQAEEVSKLLPDLLPLAKAEVDKWLGGTDASLDTSVLEADLVQIKSDAPRCALAAAIDVLASQSTSTVDSGAPGQPRALAAATSDGNQLRATFASVRGKLGWAPLHLANGRVL